MMKSEFELLIQKGISPDDYAIIEYVYSFHPSISETNGKREIANIYKLPGGIRIIRDMLPTANTQENLENSRKHLKNEVEALKNKIAQIDQRMEELRS